MELLQGSRAKAQSGIDDRLRDLLQLHFHPERGSLYWLQRQEQLGWSVRDRVRSCDDLWRLRPTPLEDLRRYPVRAFIPKALHRQWPRGNGGHQRRALRHRLSRR